LMLALLMLTTRLPVRWTLSLIPIAVLVALVVNENARFRRFETLSDMEYVENRIGWSINKGLLEVIGDYPIGAGLGRAAGTSIPFFLQDSALPPIGLENEYARIALEQGILGLLLWVAFLVWVVARRPAGRPGWTPLQLRLMWSLTLVCWASALTGTGILSSIPGTMLLLLEMGLVASRSSAEQSQPSAAFGGFGPFPHLPGLASFPPGR
jgi:hypothetical protein